MTDTGPVSGIHVACCCCPASAVTVRRLHEHQPLGLVVFIVLIPLIGALILLYWMIKPSDPTTTASADPSARRGGPACRRPARSAGDEGVEQSMPAFRGRATGCRRNPRSPCHCLQRSAPAELPSALHGRRPRATSGRRRRRISSARGGRGGSGCRAPAVPRGAWHPEPSAVAGPVMRGEQASVSSPSAMPAASPPSDAQTRRITASRSAMSRSAGSSTT